MTQERSQTAGDAAAMSSLSQQARAIFAEALQQVDVDRAMQRHLQCDGETLVGG